MKKQTQIMLGKMVGMLGSDHDGEILAAVRSIRRLLESEKMTFGDLVVLVTGGKVSAQSEVTRYDGLAGMAANILHNAARMKSHEIRFVQSIMTQATLNPHMRMTEKQAKWFSWLFDHYAA
jgi:hypothetical protein